MRNYWTKYSACFALPTISSTTRYGLLGFSAFSFLLVGKYEIDRIECVRDIALKKERLNMVRDADNTACL